MAWGDPSLAGGAARSSTSLFDQLGDTSSTGTLQASSAQRAPRRAAALLEKMGCSSRGPWSAFPWSWRPPRSSTGKTKVVGLVELSMPAPLYHDGISTHQLALCDPPTGGPTCCRPLSVCLPPVGCRSVRICVSLQGLSVLSGCRGCVGKSSLTLWCQACTKVINPNNSKQGFTRGGGPGRRLAQTRISRRL